MLSQTEKMLETLKAATGNPLDIYCVLYSDYFKKSENPGHLLEALLEYPNPVGSEDAPSREIPQEIEQKQVGFYEEILNNKIELLCQKNEPEEIFYESLWQAVFTSPETAPENSEQGAVLLKILNEKMLLLPYFQAKDLVQMENVDFRQKLSEIAPNIQGAMHMLMRGFSQRTEKTSQLCRFAEGLSREDASVYWAVVLDVLQKIYMMEGRQQGDRKAEENSENGTDS